MPLYAPSESKLFQIKSDNFKLEKELQILVEGNLDVIFNCKFVATEFATGTLHGGRIDTLALSEDGNPVIIEYKKVESSELINQSLYYLHWIQDHHGDFEIACQKQLGSETKVDWSDVRVICLAPDYKKFDVHAVEVMGANIELWKYRRFANGMLYLEEVYRRAFLKRGKTGGGGGPPVVVHSYTFEEHLKGRPQHIVNLAQGLREFIQDLDTAIEEAPKKFYVPYRTSQNVVCLEIQKKKIYVFLKLSKDEVGADAPSTYRNVSSIGHYGTGDAEFTVATERDFEAVKPFIEMSYQKIG